MSHNENEPNSLSLAFVEELYRDYLKDARSAPEDWRRYFERFPPGDEFAARPQTGPSFPRASLFGATGPPAGDGAEAPAEMAALQHRVDQLIRNYRARGHIIARADPLGLPRPEPPELDPRYYGFGESDLDRPFSGELVCGSGPLTLRRILECLRNTYCRSIGAQFMHIDDLSVREWLQRRMERTENRLALGRDQQLRILTRLTDAVIFEEFIHKKYVGAKSFSLEGAESLIPLLDLAIEKAGEQGIEDIVMAMAHRGRLNVLANIMGKSPRLIFREFEDKDPDPTHGGGDVKYHLGYHTDWTTGSGKSIHIVLCFNPSHLEFVNPIAVGIVRGKQDRIGDVERERVMGLLIHGDAAFAGEGVNQETLNLSELPAYHSGGTLHVVVNNQIGFTTPPAEGRSSLYATDLAKMLQIPIFHVNGEDPEAVAQAVNLAMDYRKAFKRDVVIDMCCYRRYGHNETDEPSFTQPLLYRAIQKRKSVREGYLEHLLRLGEVGREEADQIAGRRRQSLEEELSAARRDEPAPNPYRPSVLGQLWRNYKGGPEKGVEEVDTGVDRRRLAALLEQQTRLPGDFHPHPKAERFLEQRRQMARGQRPLDWAAAEALAFASLAVEGARVRLAGQDSARGTFSQRHAILHDFEDGHAYAPLQNLSENQAPVDLFNSPLSEAGVLGFEYGYSAAFPDGLVLWEAQFGDFCNAAQVIVDQVIAAAERKWGRLNGLALLLPHGFEGQGPEHSSARLERFLTLAAEDNIQIVNPTTPAQFFHCLRRQVLRPWRKPLVALTPKSLLRHPKAVSSLDDLARGRFQRLLFDPMPRPQTAARILLCSGKIYYELEQMREKLGRADVAVGRLEQLCPLPEEILQAGLAPFADGTPAVWVQEEPENMGAWRYLRERFGPRLLGRFPFSGVFRPASASPATGSARAHQIEQEEVLAKAFAGGGAGREGRNHDG